MAEVFIGIGSNIGRRKGNIEKALDLMSEKIIVNKISAFYKNPPKEGVKGGYFINCVISGQTNLHPGKLVLFLQEVEERFGRKKEHNRNEARTIDLDVLFYNNIVMNKPNLKIPHPGLHYRDFVLKGLFEIAPDKIHPVIGKSVAYLWRKINEDSFKDRRNEVNNK